MKKHRTLLVTLTAAAVALTVFAGTASATTLTSPSGTVYTGTIKAQNEGAFSLHGVATLSCNSSSFETKVEQHGDAVTAKGAISSLTFGECNHHVQVVTKGRLEIHPLSSGNGTVTWSGGLITVQFTTESGSVHCVYGGNNIDLGTLTAAPSNSGHAVLDLGSPSLPVAGGDEACGASAKATGKYKITTPTGLRVDDIIAPGTILTAPPGTTYTSTFKATGTAPLGIDTPVGGFGCSNWNLEGKIEKHGKGSAAGGKITNIGWTGCNQDLVIVKGGSLEIDATTAGNGTATWTGAEITVTFTTIFGAVDCKFGGKDIEFGEFTAAPSSSGHAVLHSDGSQLPVVEGSSVFCGETAEWTGDAKFTTPTGLRADEV